MKFDFIGKLVFADGTVKAFNVVATYYHQDNTYGNGYYLGIAPQFDSTGNSRYYDVRYEMIEDFRQFALEVIQNIWSGKNGSAKFVEEAV